jgi:alpha-1,3-fucosyltransferase 10
MPPLHFLLYNEFWFSFPKAHPGCPGAYTLTSDKAIFDVADAVLFHVPTLRSKPAPRRIRSVLRRRTTPDGFPSRKARPEQLWVAVSKESSVNYPLLADAAFMSRFDVSMTYRRDSTIPLLYVEEGYRRTLLQPPVPKTAVAPAVYFASNGRTANRREQFVLELMRHLRVDSYGRSLRNRELADDRGQSTKLETISRSSFTLAFENSNTVDYVTEKFYDPLIVGSVPIYMGAPNIADFAPAPNSFIDVRDFAGPKDLAGYLLELRADPERYASYMSWKQEGFSNPSFLDMLSSVNTNPMCRLATLAGRPRQL